MITDAILKKITISGKILGNFFLNEIEQVFENKSEENVEFIYTFPMPADASISGFSATTPSGKYVGYVKENNEALKDYQEAISKGDSAFMLESFRDNIFQVSLGNVAVGEEISVNISYIQDLVINAEELRLKIPTLVSPRYIPGVPIGNKKGMGASEPTSEVPDADFITPVVGDTTYKVNFDITFDLDNNIKEIASPSHTIEKCFSGGKGNVKVLSAKANSDFILNFSLAGSHNEKLIISEPSDDEYFIYSTFVPKFSCETNRDSNKEYIFLIDVSGSMHGQNLEAAKKALQIALRNMEQGDEFNIIAFESTFECFAKNSVKYNEQSFIAANEWIDHLYVKGGTEIFPAIKYAIESVNVANQKEKIIMLLTDGQIGNEDTIIGYVNSNFDGRVFCVGIDVNINDSFLNKLSTIGNGFAEFYYPRSNEDLGYKVAKQFARSNAPYLKDIKFDISGKYEVAGKPLKLLYSNECYNMVIKTDTPFKLLKIIGTDGENEIKIEIPVSEKENDPKLLRQLWAKKILTEMELKKFGINPRHDNLPKEKMIDISTKYGVLCRYTGYIAVNERDDKLEGLPIVAVIPVDEPKENFQKVHFLSQRRINAFDENFCYCNMPAKKSEPPSFFSKLLDLCDISPKTRNKARKNRENMELNIPLSFDGDLFIDELYDTVTKNEITVKSFTDNIIKKFMVFETEESNINFSENFEKIDMILSLTEQFITEKDINLYNCYIKINKTLDLLCNEYLKNHKLIDISAKQNFDGSFFQCKQLKIKYSLKILNLFLNDSETFIYQRQINKLVLFLKNATLTEDEEKEFQGFVGNAFIRSV